MEQTSRTKLYAFGRPGIYRIHVQGRLNEGWSERLAGMRITTRDAVGETDTTLSGELQDQAELLGILNTLYELHLTLLLVERIDDEQPAAPK